MVGDVTICQLGDKVFCKGVFSLYEVLDEKEGSTAGLGNYKKIAIKVKRWHEKRKVGRKYDFTYSKCKADG